MTTIICRSQRDVLGALLQLSFCRALDKIRHSGEAKEPTNSESISSNFNLLVRLNANLYPWKVNVATQVNSPF